MGDRRMSYTERLSEKTQEQLEEELEQMQSRENTRMAGYAHRTQEKIQVEIANRREEREEQDLSDHYDRDEEGCPGHMSDCLRIDDWIDMIDDAAVINLEEVR